MAGFDLLTPTESPLIAHQHLSAWDHPQVALAFAQAQALTLYRLQLHHMADHKAGMWIFEHKNKNWVKPHLFDLQWLTTPTDLAHLPLNLRQNWPVRWFRFDAAEVLNPTVFIQQKPQESYYYILNELKYAASVEKRLRQLAQRQQVQITWTNTLPIAVFEMYKATAQKQQFFDAYRWKIKLKTLETLADFDAVRHVLAHVNGTLAAAATLLVAPQNDLQYAPVQWLSGYNVAEKGSDATTAVFNDIYTQLHKEGYQKVYGGGAATTSLAAFKASFGATRFTVYRTAVYRSAWESLALQFLKRATPR